METQEDGKLYLNKMRVRDTWMCCVIMCCYWRWSL